MAATPPPPAPVDAPNSFDLTEEHVTALAASTARGGRAAAPSVYLADVRAALATPGVKRGIKLEGTNEAELSKARRKVYLEFAKAIKTLEAEDANKGKFVRIAQDVRYNHPKLGSFVAFSVSTVDRPAPVAPTA